MNSRSKVGCGLIVGLTMVFTSLAPAPDNSPKVRRAVLVAQRLEIRKTTFAAAYQHYEASRADPSGLSLASHRLVEAYRQGAIDRAETILAAKNHLELLKKSTAFEKARLDNQLITRTQFDDLQDAILEAEIWLIDAEAK